MTKPPPGAPWAPPKYEDADVGAIQALLKGEAQPHQQQRALKYIIETICDTYGLSYRESERDTAFAEGKRFVGTQIVKLTKINISALRKSDGRRSTNRDPSRDPTSERSSEQPAPRTRPVPPAEQR